MTNGQTLDQSRGLAKLNGRKGHIRIRLPDAFFDGIASGVEGRALGVMVVDKLQNSTSKVGGSIGNGSPPESVPGQSRSLEVKSDEGTVRDLVGEEPTDTEQRYAEVGFVIEFLLDVDAPTLQPSTSYIPSANPTPDWLSATATFRPSTSYVPSANPNKDSLLELPSANPAELPSSSPNDVPDKPTERPVVLDEAVSQASPDPTSLSPTVSEFSAIDFNLQFLDYED